MAKNTKKLAIYIISFNYYFIFDIQYYPIFILSCIKKKKKNLLCYIIPYFQNKLTI